MPAFDPEPAPPEARLRPLLGEIPSALFTERFYLSCELVDAYALEWAVELAHRLGLAEPLAQAVGAGELLARRGFTPGFLRPLTWILERLRAAGLVAALDGGGGERRFRRTGPLPAAQLADRRRQGLAIDPENARFLDLLDVAAEVYPEVARGATTGEAALLGAGHAALWAAYFSNANPVYDINNRVAAAAAVRRLPAGKVRLLEVGAGTGSSSLALLEELAAADRLADVAAFQVTEPVAFFRRRGQRELAARFPAAPLTFGPLDIDRSWEAQGIAPGSLELIFGVNVFHVARDLPVSLREGLRSLAPGGWLIAGECVRPYGDEPVAAELIFQIFQGFVDVMTDPELRPQPGFLTPEQWRALFQHAGFCEVAIRPDVRQVREIYRRFQTAAVCGRREPSAL